MYIAARLEESQRDYFHNLSLLSLSPDLGLLLPWKTYKHFNQNLPTYLYIYFWRIIIITMKTRHWVFMTSPKISCSWDMPSNYDRMKMVTKFHLINPMCGSLVRFFQFSINTLSRICSLRGLSIYLLLDGNTNNNNNNNNNNNKQHFMKHIMNHWFLNALNPLATTTATSSFCQNAQSSRKWPQYLCFILFRQAGQSMGPNVHFPMFPMST